MRQAIITKYIGPTNHRGSRVKASAEAGSVIVPWDDELDVEDNHRVAARMLAQKYGWGGEWIGGGTSNGYVWVSRPTTHEAMLSVLADHGAFRRIGTGGGHEALSCVLPDGRCILVTDDNGFVPVTDSTWIVGIYTDEECAESPMHDGEPRTPEQLRTLLGEMTK